MWMQTLLEICRFVAPVDTQVDLRGSDHTRPLSVWLAATASICVVTVYVVRTRHRCLDGQRRESDTCALRIRFRGSTGMAPTRIYACLLRQPCHSICFEVFWRMWPSSPRSSWSGTPFVRCSERRDICVRVRVGVVVKKRSIKL